MNISNLADTLTGICRSGQPISWDPIAQQPENQRDGDNQRSSTIGRPLHEFGHPQGIHKSPRRNPMILPESTVPRSISPSSAFSVLIVLK